MAFSDHDALFSHNDLTDDEFVALTAYEISVRNDNGPEHHAYKTIIDFNLISKIPDNITQIGFHPDSVEWLVEKGVLTADDVKNIKYAGDMENMHTYYPGDINKIIKTANENNYLVTMNHPMWSLMTYNDYSQFEGL